MSRIRLNLKRLAVPVKITKGRQYVTAMTNNGNFPSPHPSLADVAGALDELEKSYALVQSAKAEVTTRVSAQENAAIKVDQVLTQLAAHVESVAGGDDTIITSAGMQTKASPSAPTSPSPPQGLTAKAGKHDGEIDLSWRAVYKARSYTIDSSTDPANASGWTHVGIATSATKQITGLKSGTRYWFRVAAINSVGQSGWSEHATKIVP